MSIAVEPTSVSVPSAASARSKVVREAMPRSVRIQVVVRGEVRRSGSGVVVAVEGAPEGRSFVVTNAHVVDPAGLSSPVHEVLIERQGRVERTLPARLVGLGRVPENDLAVLEVDAVLPAVSLADERELDVGDDLVVVGAPYGRSLSVSGGMLSQLEAEPGEAGEAGREGEENVEEDRRRHRLRLFGGRGFLGARGAPCRHRRGLPDGTRRH